MPLKMLNRHDLIKKFFEAFMNFKGICNQNIFLTRAGMECINVFVWKHGSIINCICAQLSANLHQGV